MSSGKKLVRERFRNAVFERARHRCEIDPEHPHDNLDAHHITDRNEMPNGGYVRENGIALCPECHILAEVWHVSDKQIASPGYHPDELYARIGSSPELAIAASRRLK